MLKTARSVALDIKEHIDSHKSYSNLILASSLNSEPLSDLDKSLVTELVSGTLRRQGSIDWLLDHFSKTPFENVPSRAKNILRIAVYQLLYTDHIPDYAAINEAVEQSKVVFHKGMASFTNGLLRTIARSREDLPWPDRSQSLLNYLSVFYSHPKWMVELWLREIGEEETERLCAYNNERPSIMLRVNTLKTDPRELLAEMTAAGLDTKPGPLTKETIELTKAALPIRYLDNGLIYVQDESSVLVGYAVAPLAGETVIDLCGAPGGKATHMAELMRDKGRVIVVDLNKKRLKLVTDNAKRLGISICETMLGDAGHPLDNLPVADRVLVDAPCSGLGVLRRRADLRWRKLAADIEQLAILQLRLLTNAADYVKPGGRLVYSVCTMTREETTDVVAGFLQNRPDFAFQPLPVVFKDLGMTNDSGFLQIWPQQYHMDGMFIASFKRV